MIQHTTRDGWWQFVPTLRKREAFKTHGALWGEPTGSYGPLSIGRLPAEYRASVHDADYVVYSYGTPIAWHLPAADTWYVPDEKYSVTTSRHQSAIGTAVQQIEDVDSRGNA